MQNHVQKIDRRDFLARFGLTTAGLCVGYYAFAAGPTNEPAKSASPKPTSKSPGEQAAASGLKPNAFVHVAPNGQVTTFCHRSEMGQGIRSSLPVLLADELGADMARVSIVQGDGDKAYGDQNTDGSNSVRGIYDDMRRAAATARMMLTQAAAKTWQVEPATCTAFGHSVVHSPSGRKLDFGELALAAQAEEIPAPSAVILRSEGDLPHLGKDLPLLDSPAYVTGKAQFGADVKLPGMLIAVIARPPVVGGRVKAFDAKKAEAVPGVKHIVPMPEPKAPYMFQPWGGVAVVAENTWAAIKGRGELKIDWEHGPNGEYDTKTFRAMLQKSLKKGGKPLRQVGDVTSALKSASRRVEAHYYVPHLPHVPMEPPAAIAVFEDTGGGRCEVWAPTQNPQAAQTEVARVLGIPVEHVVVHVTFLGGAFGRKSKADFVSEAAFLAKKLGVPVRVQFTREDDIQNDYLNTVSAQHLAAGLDKTGRVIAWWHKTAFPPIGSLFDPKVDRPSAGDLQQGVLDYPFAIPNLTAEACAAKAHVRTGWLRSVYNIFHAFATCSFIDEIAHARGRDSRDVLLEIIGSARVLSEKDLGVAELQNYGGSLDKHPVDAGRLRNVIERVTFAAGWEKRRQKQQNAGRGLGLAAHRSFLSYVAVVAAVTKKAEAFSVDEVWIAIDAGTIINRDRVRSQMEGSVINGMNHALYGGVTHKKGAVEQTNFDGVGLVRMGYEPKAIHVDIVESNHAPGGVGEPGVPPVAPAIANAVFALTGKRYRSLPLV